MGRRISKLYLSGIEIVEGVGDVPNPLGSKLYLSGIEILESRHHLLLPAPPNCTLVELKSRGRTALPAIQRLQIVP